MKDTMQHILIGAGSIFSLFPNRDSEEEEFKLGRFPSFPKSAAEAFQADREAMAGDWRRVGNDLRKSMAIISREL